MERFAPAILLLCVGLAFSRGDDPADEHKKLEGIWSSVSAEVNGKMVPDAQKPPRLEFKANKLIGLSPEMTFTIDPSKSPKYLDLAARVGGAEIKIPAIYEISGDDLKVCIPLILSGKSLDLRRPEGFETKASPAVLIRLKRLK